MADAAQRIVDDLLTLEVNIVVKNGMTARKMPEAGHALLDVLDVYDEFLCVIAGKLNTAWSDREHDVVLRKEAKPVDLDAVVDAAAAAADGPSMPMVLPPGQLLRVDRGPDVVSVETFGALRERAVEAEALHRDAVVHHRIVDDGDGIILKRIFRNCDQVKGILQLPEVQPNVGTGISRKDGAKELGLRSDDVITIRKIWEVGTEKVVMQTVAQLDGDVVTRIQQSRAESKVLQDLHQQAVATSLSHWHFLFETVSTILTSAVRGFFLR